MTNAYRTVKGRGMSEIIINKSRFISYVKRTESEDEAAFFLAEIKKQHWDATHNCSAYVVGRSGERQKADDDGEPGGTAGKPILEVIKKNALTDVTVVVTRYFGGVKLGAGGLVRAYAKAAAAGLDAAGLVTRRLYLKMAVKIDYTMLGGLENYLRSQNYHIFDKQFDAKVLVRVLVAKEEAELFRQKITTRTFAQAVVFEDGEIYADIE